VKAQKVQPKSKTGNADIALNLINKLYGIERDLKGGSDAERKTGPHEQSLPIVAQLKSWSEKTQPRVSAQNAFGKPLVIWQATGADLNGRWRKATYRSTTTSQSARSPLRDGTK
jgi:hypothetical protein